MGGHSNRRKKAAEPRVPSRNTRNRSENELAPQHNVFDWMSEDTNMNDKQRLIVGFSGIALGNALLAIESWLRTDSLISIGGELVLALSMAALAAMYLFDFTQYDPPRDSRMWELLPTTVVLLGIITSALGAIFLAMALVD